jgi:predicted Abi (CAAX) family protease
MAESFSGQFWQLVDDALSFSPDLFTNLASASDGPWIALLVLLLAALSEGIGQSIVLFANKVKPFNFVLSLITSALIFAATYLFWVASTWLVIGPIFKISVTIGGLALALALCYAPKMFGFLVALPYFGTPISVLLSIWTLLSILLGLRSTTGLTLWQSVIAAGGGWLVLQLGQRTVGQPLAQIAQWIKTKSAGSPLITDWAELNDWLDDASQPAQSVSEITWEEAESEGSQGGSSRRLWRFMALAFAIFSLIGILTTSLRGRDLWLQALDETANLIINLTVVTSVAVGVAILLTPLESMSWWAGWQKERPLNPGVAVRPPQRDTAIARYVAYLDGINQGTHGYLPEVQQFLDGLADALPPNVLLVKGIIPYSVSNRQLTDDGLFAWVWRLVDNFKSAAPRLPIGFIINIRNIFAVMVSADARYGPLQNRGLAQVLYDSLLFHGYQPGSGTPITLIGFSGGGQMSMGSARYLAQATNAPIQVISIAGVISGNTGAMQTERVYHLVGDRDPVAKSAALYFPARWPIALLSNWNMAKRRGRILFISLGDVAHSDKDGPMGAEVLLPDGRSHLQQTIDIVTGILLQDWLRTGLDKADYVRSSNYELYLAAPFNRVEYYPVGKVPDLTHYQPVGNWLGRLVLPALREREPERFVYLEVYHTPPAYAHLVGRLVRLQWSDDPEVQAYVQLVTMDVTFAEQVQVSQRNGVVHPDRINHWARVDPLESITGAHPIDDVVVRLPDPVQVVEEPDREPRLLIQADPVHITGRYYGLVQILEPVGDDRFCVRHYGKASGKFDGPEEVVYFPPVIPNRDDIYQSTTHRIEKSPLNLGGWYIYGALDEEGEFVVQALAPYHLFDLMADIIIIGKKATVHHINFEYWQGTRDQKGQVINTLLLPQIPKGTEPVPDPQEVWQSGDLALLMEVYGGIGGNKQEAGVIAGMYFGHFSFGIARVLREPLTDKLRFDLDYRQIFTHSPEAVIAGSVGWTRFMGDRQYGRAGFRPVAQVLVKFPPFTEDYDFDGVTFSPMNRLVRELDVMAARYRIGDGTGTTSVSPVNSCVQDSVQALLTALNRMVAEFQLNPLMLKWLREHPDHEQTQRFCLLMDLLKSLESNLQPLGFTRRDWRTGELTLGRFAGETPGQTLINTLASWRSILPRMANDIMAMIFLQLGATVWIIRANQIGGHDPDIEPIAPTDFGFLVPRVKRAKPLR